jgi:hypothetical protein
MLWKRIRQPLLCIWQLHRAAPVPKVPAVQQLGRRRAELLSRDAAGEEEPAPARLQVGAPPRLLTALPAAKWHGLG